MTDNINPAHYQYDGFEVYDVLRQVFPHDPIGWQVGKYVLRADRKNGLEDWRKAQWYLEKKIAELESSETVSERYADELADDEGVLLPVDPQSFYESMKRCADQNGRLANYADGGVVSREPRVFESWRDIPDDVTAVEVDGGGIATRLGDGWTWDAGWQWSDEVRDDLSYAPYKEVIE